MYAIRSYYVSLDKAGITKRLGYIVVKKAGTSVTRFTFILCIGLGIASSVMHDAAACAIGIVTMIPLMRAAGIHPYSNTAKFRITSYNVCYTKLLRVVIVTRPGISISSVSRKPSASRTSRSVRPSAISRFLT